MKRRHFLLTGAAMPATFHHAPAAAAQSQLVSTTKPDGLNPPGIRTAGVKMIAVSGGKYKVWTKRIGHGPVKVLLLHGGPGFSHDYLEAMESFLPQAGIEMIYYDQLGCGNSDHPEDPTLWTLTRYLEELEEVRIGLGLDDFVLYGHSWGGLLAIEYALQHQRRLRGLVISNMRAGIQSVLRHLASIKRSLPPAVLARLERHVHFESFGARLQAQDLPVRVHLRQTGMTLDVAPGASILDAMIDAEVMVSYECKRGECGNCYAGVLAGEPVHRDICLSPQQRAQGMTPCVSWCRSAELELDL